MSYHKDYYYKNKDRILAYRKEWRKRNQKRLYDLRLEREKQYKIDWKMALEERGMVPRCQICGKELQWFFGGNRQTSVCFDHRHGHDNTKILHPAQWLRSRPATKKNVDLFMAEDFGILCHCHNRWLPTDQEIRQQIKGYIDDTNSFTRDPSS